MKLCLQNVKQLKQNTDNRLTRNVCNYVISHWNDYDDKKAIFTDVLYNGCQSGIVGSLIYYSDTTKYFQKYRKEIADLMYDTMVNTGLFDMSQIFGDKFDKKYQEEINDILYEIMNDCGITSPKDLFGKKWDEEDPLAYYDYNQNLLAWFGFEETLRNIGMQFERLQNYI